MRRESPSTFWGSFRRKPVETLIPAKRNIWKRFFTISGCGSQRRYPLPEGNTLSPLPRSIAGLALCALLAFSPCVGAAQAPEQDFEVITIEEQSPDPTPVRNTELLETVLLHSPDSSRGKLWNRWFQFHAARFQDELEETNRLFQELVLTFKREGFETENRVGGAFAYEGFRALGKGDSDHALTLFQKALFLAPGLPGPYLGMALARKAEGESIWKVLRFRIRALSGGLLDLQGTAAQVGNLLLLSVLSLGVIGCTVIFLLVARTQSRWRHDLEERIAALGYRELAGVLAMVVFFLPAFLWLGPFFLFAYWMFLLFPYFRKSERAIAVAILVGILLASPSVGFLKKYAAFWWDPGVEELLSLADGGYSREALGVVNRNLQKEPLSPDLKALLAQVYGDGGYSNEAYAEYRRILEGQPDAAWVYNNLGNLYLRSQQYGSALQEYHKAIDTDPGLVESYYNLHLAHLDQFQLEEAEGFLRQAQKLAPERISRWVEEGKKQPWMPGILLPVDIRVSRKRLIQEALVLQPWDREGEGPGPNLEWREVSVLPGGLGLLGLFVFTLFTKKRRLAEICDQCGRTFCHRCQKGKIRRICSQCHNLLARKESLSPINRTTKTAEIRDYAARGCWTHRTVSLILPGAGHFLGGRTLFGTMILFVWFFAWVDLALRAIWIPRIALPYGNFIPMISMVAIICLVLVWVLANMVPCTRKS